MVRTEVKTRQTGQTVVKGILHKTKVEHFRALRKRNKEIKTITGQR